MRRCWRLPPDAREREGRRQAQVDVAVRRVAAAPGIKAVARYVGRDLPMHCREPRPVPHGVRRRDDGAPVVKHGREDRKGAVAVVGKFHDPRLTRPVDDRASTDLPEASASPPASRAGAGYRSHACDRLPIARHSDIDAGAAAGPALRLGVNPRGRGGARGCASGGCSGGGRIEPPGGRRCRCAPLCRQGRATARTRPPTSAIDPRPVYPALPPDRQFVSRQTNRTGPSS